MPFGSGGAAAFVPSHSQNSIVARGGAFRRTNLLGDSVVGVWG